MLTIKRLLALLCLVALSLTGNRAAAQEAPLAYERIDLNDGRKLLNVVIKTYDPQTDMVLLMAKKTAMKLPVGLFPSVVSTVIRKNAPKAGSSTSSTHSPAPSRQNYYVPSRQPVVVAQSASPSTAEINAQAHKAAALTRAQNYYRYEFQTGSNSIRVTATNFETEDPLPVPGWTDRYSIKGRVLLEYFDSKGNSFNRTSDHFEIFTEQKPRASIKVIDFLRK